MSPLVISVLVCSAVAPAMGIAAQSSGFQHPRIAADTPVTTVLPLPTGLSYQQVERTLGALMPVARPASPAADSTAAASGPRASRNAIDGLVVDETVTRIGHDFYDVFYGAWKPPPGAANYTIRIQEQPAPGLGTRVLLLLNDEVLFQLQLQPRYDVIEELGKAAAAYTRQELARRQPTDVPTAAGDPGGGG